MKNTYAKIEHSLEQLENQVKMLVEGNENVDSYYVLFRKWSTSDHVDFQATIYLKDCTHVSADCYHPDLVIATLKIKLSKVQYNLTAKATQP